MHADDKDSNENAKIVYSLDNKNFTINERGEIAAAVRLDADQNRERFFIYRFHVIAIDGGQPNLSSKAIVSLFIYFILW